MTRPAVCDNELGVVLRLLRGADGVFRAALSPDVAAQLLSGVGVERWHALRAAPSEGVDDGSAFDLCVRDISDEQHNKEALRISESRLRLLADSARDVVWTIAPDGRVTYISPAIEAVRGYTPDEARAQTLEETHTPDSAARSAAYFVEMLTAVQQGRKPEPFRGDMEYRCKDGSTVWTEVLAFPMLDDQGQLVELLGITHDLTGRRTLEAELRDAQRMEAMGRMAAGVAHEVNNVLATIVSATGLLRGDAPGSPEAQSRFATIGESVDRASALTAQLLSFSRQKHIVLEHARIGDLLEQARPLLARVAAPSSMLSIRVAEGAEDAVIHVDRAHFEQVLLHLVANARDAMGGGSLVDVLVATESLTAPRATTRTGKLPAGTYVTIAVEDTGTGMAPGVLEHLFEPFFTTKSQDKGAGLGLPTVFGILKQHHAGVTVDSEPGRGSRFTVYWPTDHRELPAAPTPGGAPTYAAPVSRRERPMVLVVDDEPMLLTLNQRLLQRVGCDAVTAGSGAEAIEIARARRGELDLIVTDVRMPEMTGTEMVDALIRDGIDLPVLFVSGQLGAPIPTGWPASVPRRFLGKPFRLEQLTHALAELGVLPGVDRP
jgi:PAS domain S-box-containing protein